MGLDIHDRPYLGYNFVADATELRKAGVLGNFHIIIYPHFHGFKYEILRHLILADDHQDRNIKFMLNAAEDVHAVVFGQVIIGYYQVGALLPDFLNQVIPIFSRIQHFQVHFGIQDIGQHQARETGIIPDYNFYLFDKPFFK